jgi:hypothetical protein
MTADWFPFDGEFLKRVSRRIVNEVDGVCRVLYDVTVSIPPRVLWQQYTENPILEQTAWHHRNGMSRVCLQMMRFGERLFLSKNIWDDHRKSIFLNFRLLCRLWVIGLLRLFIFFTTLIHLSIYWLFDFLIVSFFSFFGGASRLVYRYTLRLIQSITIFGNHYPLNDSIGEFQWTS